jgi:hypothetical protein
MLAVGTTNAGPFRWPVFVVLLRARKLVRHNFGTCRRNLGWRCNGNNIAVVASNINFGTNSVTNLGSERSKKRK